LGKEVIVIVGPTASGKTRLGIDLALELNGEIISADSRQVYKHINIGTAKPSQSELESVKHHFISILELDAYYNVSMFEKDALKKISELFKEGKQPVVVGGSGLYIKALVDGIFDEGEVNFEIREELIRMRNEFGNEYLYHQLKSVDPNAAKTMLPQNWKRVIRALEVFHSTGKSILELHKIHKREVEFDFVQFGLNWEREVLYKRIEDRVDWMFENGLVEEVKSLYDKGYNEEVNSLNTVGYKEIFSYFHGVISLERAKELIKRNTRRFAKRQFTWFKKDERIHWFDIEDDSALLKIKSKIINQLRTKNEREN